MPHKTRHFALLFSMILVLALVVLFPSLALVLIAIGGSIVLVIIGIILLIAQFGMAWVDQNEN